MYLLLWRSLLVSSSIHYYYLWLSVWYNYLKRGFWWPQMYVKMNLPMMPMSVKAETLGAWFCPPDKRNKHLHYLRLELPATGRKITLWFYEWEFKTHEQYSHETNISAPLVERVCGGQNGWLSDLGHSVCCRLGSVGKYRISCCKVLLLSQLLIHHQDRITCVLHR